jgi:DNA repair protein RadC
MVSVGSLNASVVTSRESFKGAFLHNACSVIFFHNHPSGNADPSPEDINITLRLKECGELLHIDVLDHMIVGEGCFISLKEQGLF